MLPSRGSAVTDPCSVAPQCLRLKSQNVLLCAEAEFGSPNRPQPNIKIFWVPTLLTITYPPNETVVRIVIKM